MAGLSKRFQKSGFTQPKYMLEANGNSLFEHSLKTFEAFFAKEKFLFILNNKLKSEKFVEEKVKVLGINDYEIISLPDKTRGQAETVFLGLKQISLTGSITIFNIDTFRSNFHYPTISTYDGFVEVFNGIGENWSFVQSENRRNKLISKTTEKQRISDLCCTGLYHFNNYLDFCNSFKNYLSMPKNKWEKGEVYVAPLYNWLINSGKKFVYIKVPKNLLSFFGTPDEYNKFLNKN